MLKKIILLSLIAQVSHASQESFMTKNLQAERYAEVDAYIKNFNNLIQLSRASAANPGKVVEAKELSNLSPEDKKWLARELVKAPTANLALSRLGDIVTLRHSGSGVTLARVNVENYSKTGRVTWDGKEFPVREILQEGSLATQNKMFKKEITTHVESKKSFKQKVIENAFFIITLPLQLISACTEMLPGSEGALAVASGHSLSPVYDQMPYVSSMGTRGGGVGADIKFGRCIGYNCSNGHQYDLNGNRVQFVPR